MDISSLNPVNSGRIAYDAQNAVSTAEELSRRTGSGESGELRDACNQFEAIFVKIMLDAMKKTLSDDTLIPKNSGEKLFEDKLYDEYAVSLSRTANLGIADMMYRQLDSVASSSLLSLGV